ncbi:Protein phosphatase 1H [Ataeniobius toweri]|uniref:Protein phosphatase 1H n=1 Tax=Ataeniobius toweri TaxID=208326 RepID=A0ABU7CGY0_9TELE|nr:Protein phosphatase 1H [Ataeniobius toweri]
MLTRMKTAVASLMGGVMPGGSSGDHPGGPDLPLKFPYSRPEFLGLCTDEIECSADHIARPILILKETKRLPWSTGYAEFLSESRPVANWKLRNHIDFQLGKAPYLSTTRLH